MTKVVPFEEQRDNPDTLNIARLNPDTDGDGHVDEWEKLVYERILAADLDGDGELSKSELFSAIKRCAVELKEAGKGGIPISSLDPDTDGDGKVEPWEVEVFERIKSADADHSGAICALPVHRPPLLPHPRSSSGL